MAFEFNGTFTLSQFKRFESYLRDQIGLAEDRIVHLKAEKDRIGNLGFAYDGTSGIPTDSATNVKGTPPPPTYIGKLFGAYEALGGDAFFDLQTRSKSQALYRLPGTEVSTGQLMSNGEVIGRPGLNDADSAQLMDQLFAWTQADLDRRRNFLERKVRRAQDYSDQLQDEINTLTTIVEGASVEGSLAFLLQEIGELTNDRRYTAITNDAGAEDPHGKYARAPVAGYEPGPEGATAQNFERTYDGVAKPGVAATEVGK